MATVRQVFIPNVGLVPEDEAWLWQNAAALAAVRRGLAESAKGDTHDLGSFADFADIELE